MTRLVGLCLVLAATLLYADTPPSGSAQELYAAGMRQTEQGNLPAARTAFQHLLDVYPKDALASQARGAIDATVLFEDGQARVKAGKYDTARVAFDTLIAVYPENPLADRAKSALSAISEKEKANGRTVKAVEFRDLPTVPPGELLAAMDAREVRLTVGKPCRSKDLAQAKVALEEILAEKGMANAHVEVQTRSVPPDSVDVIFSLEKTHGSLLLSPWRLAMAGWHRVGL